MKVVHRNALQINYRRGITRAPTILRQAMIIIQVEHFLEYSGVSFKYFSRRLEDTVLNLVFLVRLLDAEECGSTYPEVQEATMKSVGDYFH